MISFFRQLSQGFILLWQRINPRLMPLLSTMWFTGLSIAGFGLWAFAQITDEMIEQETLAFDQSVLLTLHHLHRPWLDRLALVITNLGDPLTMAITSGVLVLLLLIRRRQAESAIFAVAASGAIGLNVLLKALFVRPRPQLWERMVTVRYHSFPSGHAMVSMVVLGLIAYWLAVRFPKRRSLIFLVTPLLIGAIGLSRLYLGVHWPTDVIAGYAAGLVWLVICILSLEMLWKQRSRYSSRSSR